MTGFPQAEAAKNALTGAQENTRPTIGFVIAACQLGSQREMLTDFVDFDWWGKAASSDQLQGEQLRGLRRDVHEWGILHDNVSEKLRLPPREDIAEEIRQDAEIGLSCTISMSFEEKRKVVDAWPNLSAEQIAELCRIFREEQLKFAILAPGHQQQIGEMSKSVNSE